MGFLPDFKRKKTPIRRKLFAYMFTLAVIVLVFLAIGVFFLDNFSSTKAAVSKDLSFQSDVFEKQIDKYFDDLTMMTTALSDDMSKITAGYLAANAVSLSDVNDDLALVEGLQRAVFNKLHEELLKTDCSGAFVIFNATVNTTIEHAQFSRTGLYFQRSTLDATDESILLYRGIAELGRSNGIMPHRKWRLEFKTDLIPEWSTLPTTLALRADSAVCLLSASTLPGTSERAMHFIIPMCGTDGANYGFCGFEISESYFKSFFAQVTQIERLTCTFTRKTDGKLRITDGFAAGSTNGYYLKPEGEMTVSDFGNGLSIIKSAEGAKSGSTISGTVANGSTENGSAAAKNSAAFIGRTKTINACNGEYLLTVMIPKDAYDGMAAANTARAICITLLILTVIVGVCVFFSRKFLAPLLNGLEQIKRSEHQNSSSELVEIDDLFAFLTEQDKLREQENDAMLKQRQDALDKANDEIERLSYSRKNEVDPDDYENFKNGLRSLTKTEKTVFKLYLDGKTAQEILEICDIRQSTLKYHNHNILSKLGVSSRKQMLRYATLLKQDPEYDF